MLTTSGEALKYLEKYIPRPQAKFPGLIGLKRIEKLLSFLGNPHLSYPTVHVGGTSGKGSTATFIASILSTKYKVGLYTSPHLMKVNERIKILNNFQFSILNFKSISNFQFQKLHQIWQNTAISNDDFISLLKMVIPAIEKMRNTKNSRPSYFEIITAMAFLYFKTQKVDIAVIEVGLGGRYDATNVVKPLVAVLTNVGLDHTEVLGDTVEKIVCDKAGIIKKGIAVISGVEKRSVVRIIKQRCGKMGAKLFLLNRDFKYSLKKLDQDGGVFDYFSDNIYENLRINLLGEHQVRNACLALKVMEELKYKKITIGELDIRNGLVAAFIPGRLEEVSERPLVVFDGAHNQDKMKALVKAVKVIYPGKEITVILAIKNDKDAKGILQELVKISQRIILTQYRLKTDVGDMVSHDPDFLYELVKEIDPKVDIIKIESPSEALRYVSSHVSSRDLILVTGSLYLIGEIKNIL